MGAGAATGAAAVGVETYRGGFRPQSGPYSLKRWVKASSSGVLTWRNVKEPLEVRTDLPLHLAHLLESVEVLSDDGP
jgi:hypothetical protein